MKLHFWIMGVVAGVVVTQSSYVFRSPDLGVIELEGICEVDVKAMNCWSPDGKPNPKLAELAGARFLAKPNETLPLRFKKRNLLLVLRSIQKANGAGSFYGEIETTDGIRTEESSLVGEDSGQERYNYFWLRPADNDTKTSLTLFYHFQLADKAKLEMKKGAKADVGPLSLEIESVTESPTPVHGGLYEEESNKAWFIKYSVRRTREIDGDPLIYGDPLDLKGSPIQDVDSKGNPVAPKKSPYGVRMYKSLFAERTSDLPGNYFQCLVRPDRISKVDLRVSLKKKIIFENVALIPSP